MLHLSIVASINEEKVKNVPDQLANEWSQSVTSYIPWERQWLMWAKSGNLPCDCDSVSRTGFDLILAFETDYTATWLEHPLYLILRSKQYSNNVYVHFYLLKNSDNQIFMEPEMYFYLFVSRSGEWLYLWSNFNSKMRDWNTRYEILSFFSVSSITSQEHYLTSVKNFSFFYHHTGYLFIHTIDNFLGSEMNFICLKMQNIKKRGQERDKATDIRRIPGSLPRNSVIARQRQFFIK